MRVRTQGRVVALIALLGATSIGWVQEDRSSSPVARHGLLRAEGNRIVDRSGKPVSLAGPSLFWSQWIGKYYTPEVVAWVRSDWNASVIRAAIAVEGGGYLENPDAEMARAKVVIEAAIEEGMYVIVDWHDHNAHRHEPQAIEFFTKIAREYGDRANLIYEIWNEPVRVSWPDDVKPYSERVIAAIREHDPDNLILVGSPTWSQDVDIAAADPIKDKNVAYTLHFLRGNPQARTARQGAEGARFRRGVIRERVGDGERQWRRGH